MLKVKNMSRFRRRKGLSEVVTSVILTGIMLSIALIAMGFANNMFAIQSVSTEFDQAKNIMTNLAEIIEHVSTKQGASGYVKFNSRSGGPWFERNVYNINVNLKAYMIGASIPYSESPIFSGTCNQLKYRGGSLAPAAGKYLIRGTEAPILLNNNASMGSVYVEQKDGAWIVIDYSRINVINLGTFNFSKGISATTGLPIFELVNMLQITYINITPGTFSGSGNLYVVANCRNIETSYYRIPSHITSSTTKPSDEYYIISLQVQLGSQEFNLNLNMPSYYYNGTHYLPRDTIIMLVKSNVEISVFGG